ncbi:MAG: hypothetical protein J6A77_06695 [Lachnospiraceae bacterium]|nr:hypothetical protein [Lachnospiraceae bacterium]
MVTSLSDYADLLYFEPKIPEGYFRAGYEKQAVLLPMKACKVLVPYPKEDALNLFQETILKLLNCGAKEEEWLADRLSLDLSLVEVVLKELYERKLITRSRNVTEEGIRVLEDESLSYDMKTGYIFYDYVSKSYMDAFIPDSRFQPSEIRSRKKDANIIQFFFDSTDPNSNYESAVVIKADKPELEVNPSIYDVLKVCRKQRNRERMMFSGNHTEEKDEDVVRFAHSDKVSLLNDNRDVYVATYLVIPTGDIVNKSNMQVLYPFGEGLSSPLLEPIRIAADFPENDALKNAVDELKRKQTALTENEKRGVRTYNADTIKRVDAIFSAGIQNYPYVSKRALEVESRRENILRLMKENKGKNWETINSNINDYIIAIYRLLAAALIDVSDKNDYFKNLLNSDPKHNADTLKEIALQCGFTDDEVFENYFRIKKGRVIGAYGGEGAKISEEVCALVALNLLKAKDNTGHPFYKLAQAEPTFVIDTFKLTCLRNDGMHGNNIEYNFNYVEGLGKKYFKVVSLLLDGLSFHEDQFKLDESTLLDENSIKHRKAAEHEVERLFTRGVNRYQGLTNKLVELLEEQAYGEEFLKDPAGRTISKTGESYPTYVAETIEFILKELCKRRIEKKALSKLKAYTEEYGEELLEQMKAQGFHISSIPYYSLPNISKAFGDYKMGTMQSNFYVWYFSELEQPDNLIPELAEVCPDFVQVISEAVAAREHKGFKEYADESLSFIKKCLVDCINQMIDLMIRRGLY